jgi:hypothetical protein
MAIGVYVPAMATYMKIWSNMRITFLCLVSCSIAWYMVDIRNIKKTDMQKIVTPTTSLTDPFSYAMMETSGIENRTSSEETP